MKPIDQEQEKMSMSDVLNIEEFLMPTVNDIIEGEVVRVTPQEVTVDIHGATEGTIYLNELTLEQIESAHEIVQVGDKIKAIIKKVEDEQILLSRRALLQRDRFQELKQAFEKGEVLEGKVVRAVKNALIVNIGMDAFLPANMIDVDYVSDVTEYVGQTIPVRIVELNPRNKRMTVSRKAVIVDQLKVAREEQLSTLAIGDVVKATILRIEKFGAFARFGALEGLIHISEISHFPINVVSDALEVKQVVKAKVKKIDGTKIQLSIKAVLPTPFELFTENNYEGDLIEGEVTRLTEFGAFVKVAEGVEGLVHVSELSWGHKVNLEEVLSEGKIIKVKIISINKETGRLGLSIKQVEENPWVAFASKVGDVIKGEVTNVTNIGAFIKVAPYIEGLCHFSEASWNPNERLENIVSVGSEVDVKIISIDPEKRRLGLSLRQVKPNPWHQVEFKVGSVVTGTVEKIIERGAFINVAEDVVGFLPINQIAHKHISRVEDVLTVGQVVEVKVTRFDQKQFKLELSIRRIADDLEREEFNNYMKEQDEVENETLGDLFGESLKDLL